ncbi:MAG: GNAT family N-acetyltransferase [Ruminococcus sp.]|nr:GNAT family N-acetyltransferase [Ruminococcus sp.]
MEYNIRKLESIETKTALVLVNRVFMEYEAPDYTEEGVGEFNKTMRDEEYLSKLCMYGAFAHEKLIGVIATRSEGTHIALFFVEGGFQGKGVGRSLFQTVLADCESNRITVNSSPYAVPIYKKLGFTETDTEQTVNGLRFTPMEYKF